MATDATAKLVKGARTLTISSGRYALGRDFRPPDVALEPTIAGGTSANRSGGGVKVGERANDRTWEFDVYIQNCASVREVEQAARDLRGFLLAAGDESEPLYLEYRASPAIAAAPLFGQGVLRYEIIHGALSLAEMYATTDLRGRSLPACPVRLRIKPYAVGLAQRLGSATGGVVMDTYGTATGDARGVAICQAASSAFTNPIFGHSTWNNGWTTATCLTAASSTDPNFLLPDSRVSALITSRGGGTGNLFTQALTLTSGSTIIIQALVKLPDSSSPTNSDITLVRDTTGSNACFFNVGNGIWEAAGSVVGNGAACNIGIKVGQGRSVYLLGMQTSPSIRQPFMHGDQLGSSWDGTAHSSATTRAAGRVRWAFDDILRRGQGTIRVVYQFHVDTTACARQPVFAMDNTGNFAAQYQSGSSLLFQDGVNAVTATIVAGSPGLTDVLHFTYGPAGIFAYRNGALAASGSTYSPPHDGTYLYLGTNAAGVVPAGGTFLDFTTWPTAATAAEIAADYAEARTLAASAEKVSDVPWLWTKDGDDVVDNGDSSTTDNFAVIAGVPGTAPARTQISIENTNIPSTTDGYYLSNVDLPRFYLPSASHFFFDQSGCSIASTVGGAQRLVSVASTSFTKTNMGTIAHFEPVAGREFYTLIRLRDTGASLAVRFNFTIGTDITTTCQLLNIADTFRRGFLIGPLALGGAESYGYTPQSPGLDGAVRYDVQFTRSGASADLDLDYAALFPRPLLRVEVDGTIITSAHSIVINRNSATLRTTTTGALVERCILRGDPIEFMPGVFNTLFIAHGLHGEAYWADSTITLSASVTPRYALL